MADQRTSDASSFAGDVSQSSADEIDSLFDEDLTETCHQYEGNNKSQGRWQGVSFQVQAAPLLIFTSILLCLVVACLSVKWNDQVISDQFSSDAHLLFTHIGVRAQQNLDAMASLSTSLTSFSVSSTRLNWPYITMPGFSNQASHSLDILDTSKVFLSPLVSEENRLDWEQYSNQKAVEWTNNRLSPLIFKIDPEDGAASADRGPAPKGFHPVWQIQPPTSYQVKFNLHSIPALANVLDRVYEEHNAIFTEPIPTEGNWTEHLDFFQLEDQQENEPISLLVLPVFDAFEDEIRASQGPVGVIVAPFLWKSYLENSFGANTDARGVVVVIQSSCGDDSKAFSYRIDQEHVEYLGEGDLHNPFYEDQLHTAPFSVLLHNTGFEQTSGGVAMDADYQCQYEILTYPSAVYQNTNDTDIPIILTVATVVLSVITFLAFLFFGGIAEEEFDKLRTKATETSRLVDKLFPKEIQARLFNGDQMDNPYFEQVQALLAASDDPRHQMQAMIGHDTLHFGGSANPNGQPIADLWPNCTVLFADISGFTAWSGCREPVQVFTLLESLFKAFDQAAGRRQVFKVETVGDCYVAVCGLPTPRSDHAVVMAKFAFDCVTRMNKVTRNLCSQLGADTADLQLRVGLNSGPVTAGVLRGEKGRFQLFGDTVNTAARMESTGTPNRIHISEETAGLLIEAGKEAWVSVRSDKIVAKGKGQLNTFWCNPGKKSGSTSSVASNSEANTNTLLQNNVSEEEDKILRIIDWNVELFARLIKQIVAYRGGNGSSCGANRDDATVGSGSTPPSATSASFRQSATGKPQGGTLLDEVLDILEVSKPQCPTRKIAVINSEVTLSPTVMAQLRAYIVRVSQLYHKNPFHNFEHASHVTMSVMKMLSRVGTQSRTVGGSNSPDLTTSSGEEDDTSFGLKSNPLTQFAIAFGALVHDADHPGVPNSVLVAEQTPLAVTYKNKSVAEQNSLALALGLLEEVEFKELYNTICPKQDDKMQLRHLVINTVMATDIMDKDLKEQRNARWEKAFSGEKPRSKEEVHEAVNRKATIVMEHLIQASDVAHTMQPWNIYRKWNERLFFEMYAAYESGRMANDPSANWYKGEIGFFDFYVIPLAKKLNDCGVFGVSSDEFLNYALQNRNEWEQKGEGIVAGMMQKIQLKKFHDKDTKQVM